MILAHLTDLHVRPPGLPAYRLIETTMLAERALRAVAAFRPAPDAVVISGDLTDNGLPSEYQVLDALLRRYLGHLPVYLIPGNHDRRENFRSYLGHFPGVTSDPVFVQYAVENLSVRVVMLDSLVPGAGHGELCPDRLAWLDATLGAAPDRPTVLVVHHPPIRCGLAILDELNLRDAESLAGLLRRHSQVERILCGHHHRSMVGRLAQAIVCVAPSVVQQTELALEYDAGRFVMEPPAFQLLVLQPGGGLATHTVMVEQFPGPFPYIEDSDYPGKPGRARNPGAP
jgi:3',5'-cyclic AMP phosphodiesterase CpdA